MIQEISCGIVPLWQTPDGEYEVLLIQHKGGRHRGFSKGHIEEGETPMQAATREVKEETNIDFAQVDTKMFQEKYQFLRKGETVDKRVQYFVGIAQNNEVTIDPTEIKAYIRLPIHQVKDKLTFYSTRKTREGIRKYLLGK